VVGIQNERTQSEAFFHEMTLRLREKLKHVLLIEKSTTAASEETGTHRRRSRYRCHLEGSQGIGKGHHPSGPASFPDFEARS